MDQADTSLSTWKKRLDAFAEITLGPQLPSSIKQTEPREQRDLPILPLLTYRRQYISVDQFRLLENLQKSGRRELNGKPVIELLVATAAGQIQHGSVGEPNEPEATPSEALDEVKIAREPRV